MATHSGCVAPVPTSIAEPSTGEVSIVNSAPRPVTSAPPVGEESLDEPPSVDEGWVDVEIATVGWDGVTGTPVVMLRELGGERRLPIWIGLAEAQAIARELYGVEPPRPMSHDLMASLIDALGAELEAVRVTALLRGTYHGRLELRRPDGEQQSVDTRPSDGLALGLRTGARLYVRDRLFDDVPDIRFEAPEAERQVVRALGMTITLRGDGSGDVVVVSVSGIARDAGIEIGDRLVRVAGETIEQPMDLLDALERHGRRGDLELTLRRGEDEKVVRLPLDRPREVRGPEVEV
ncbi:MAG: bifunctional nuclease domain-containing protein [Acidobacteriota bacterium]